MKQSPLIAILLLSLGLFACGENSSDNRNTSNETTGGDTSDGPDLPIDLPIDVCANLPDDTPEPVLITLGCAEGELPVEVPEIPAEVCAQIPAALKEGAGCPPDDEGQGGLLAPPNNKSTLIAEDHFRALIAVGILKSKITTANGEVEAVLDQLARSSARVMTDGYPDFESAVANPANLADMGLIESPLLESPENDIAAIADELEALLAALSH